MIISKRIMKLPPENRLSAACQVIGYLANDLETRGSMKDMILFREFLDDVCNYFSDNPTPNALKLNGEGAGA